MAIRKPAHEDFDKLVINHIARKRERNQRLRYPDVASQILSIRNLHSKHRSLIVHAQASITICDGEAAQSRQCIEQEAQVDVRRKLSNGELEHVEPRCNDLLLQGFELCGAIVDGHALQSVLQLQLQESL